MATTLVRIHTISKDPAREERPQLVRELPIELPPSASVDEVRARVQGAVRNLNLGPIRSLSAIAGGGWSVIVQKQR